MSFQAKVEEAAELWANMTHDDPFISAYSSFGNHHHVEIHSDHLYFTYRFADFGHNTVFYYSGVFYMITEYDPGWSITDFDPENMDLSKLSASTDVTDLFEDYKTAEMAAFSKFMGGDPDLPEEYLVLALKDEFTILS